MRLHYLSDDAQNAARLSASQVPAKVRAGWVWHKLASGFCAAGGTAEYSRALISPEGKIAFVSDRADGPEDLDSLPVLELTHEMVKLAVPFEEKDAAKKLGAIWVGHLKTWACAPWRVNEFAKWITGQPEQFDLLAT